MAYYGMEPFGQARGDLQAGIPAAAVYNSIRQKKSDKVWQPSDFLLNFDPEPEAEPKSAEELLAAFQALGAAANKSDGEAG